LGRVPLFFYVLHIFVIHAFAAALAWLVLGSAGWLFGQPPMNRPARRRVFNARACHSYNSNSRLHGPWRGPVDPRGGEAVLRLTFSVAAV
jgi:hypothetical protein